jgi:antitoxin component of MazEF toxin-antitoxin module
MTEVKLQERISKQGKNEYTTYVITLPKIIIESIPNFSKTKSFNVKVTNGEIILSPKK